MILSEHCHLSMPYSKACHSLTVFTILFAQPLNELLRSNCSNFPLLCGNTMKEVSQARQQRFFLLTLLLLLVLQDFFSERLAEEQRLQNGVAVAGIAELERNVIAISKNIAVYQIVYQ